MEKTPRGTGGIFVEAKPSAKLIRNGGVTCHRLLGRNFNGFLAKFSNSFLRNQEKFDKDFLNKLSNVWLGRISGKSKKNCISIFNVMSNAYKPLAEKYTFTATCQNWSQGKAFVEGYPVSKGGQNPSFSTCYTPGGRFTDAVALGGLAEGLTGGSERANYFTPYQGKSCGAEQKLLCIEE
jgi:hypothetical protein